MTSVGGSVEEEREGEDKEGWDREGGAWRGTCGELGERIGRSRRRRMI